MFLALLFVELCREGQFLAKMFVERSEKNIEIHLNFSPKFNIDGVKWIAFERSAVTVKSVIAISALCLAKE